MKKNLDFRAIILGSIADLLSSTLFALLFFSLASIELASHGLSDFQIQEHISSWTKSPEGFGFMLFFGLCFTFFGGHIAMKVSKHKSLYNALFVGVVSIITCAFTGDNGTFIQSSLVYLLPIPAALLGGYNYLRRWTF